MPALIRFFTFFALFVSCSTTPKNEAPFPIKGKDSSFFSSHEVIAGVNVLTAIIDWPAETIQLQEKYGIDPVAAKSLILPLHPLWDDKIQDLSSKMLKWDKQKISRVTKKCRTRCQCDFFKEISDKNPALKKRFVVKTKKQRSIKDLNYCIPKMPGLENLFRYLRDEQKKYKAEAVY